MYLTSRFFAALVTGCVALAAFADVSDAKLKRAELKDGVYSFKNGGTVSFNVDAQLGDLRHGQSGFPSVGQTSGLPVPCEISYRFKVNERPQDKQGYAFMLNLAGGDEASALFSMRDAKMCEAYIYKNGKKKLWPKSIGDATHKDGEWHTAKLTIMPRACTFSLDGREVSYGPHTGLLPLKKILFNSYGLVSEMKDFSFRPLEVEKPVLIEKPVFELDEFKGEMQEFAVTNTVSSKVGGIMFWARDPKGSTILSLKRGKDRLIDFQLANNGGARSIINVKRSDGAKPLYYCRSYNNRMGDWVLVTITWNEDGEARHFVNTLPYWNCFTPGQRSPEFLNPDVDGADRLVVGDPKKRTCEVKRLRIFHRPLTNTEVWNEYRRYVPVDLVMNERIVDADTDVELAIRLGPAGYFTHPCPVKLDEYKGAKVALALEVVDKDGKSIAKESRSVEVGREPLDVKLAPRAFAKGVYNLVVTVDGFYSRCYSFVAFTSDYRTQYADAGYERGEVFYERYPKTDDKDLLTQGAVTMKNTAIGEYLECGKDQTDRISFEVNFPDDVLGQPVEMEVEWPDDRPRFTGLYMYAPQGANRDYLQQAISSGYEIPQTDTMRKSTFLFFPGKPNYLFEARTLAPGMNAAVRAVRFRRIRDGFLPANRIVTPKGMEGRHFGFYDEDQTYHNNLNAQGMSLKPNQEKYPTATCFQTDEFYRYFDYIGMDTVTEPVWRYRVQFFPLEGQAGYGLWPGSGLAWVWKNFPAHGKRMIVSLAFVNLPDVDYAHKIESDYLTNGMEMYDKMGDTIPCFGGTRSANPCHPEVVKKLLNYLREPVKLYAKSGLAGIQYEICSFGTWKSLDNGYGDYTVNRFAKETGVKVPENVKERYAFLTGPEHRERWLKWRSEQVTTLVKAVRQLLDEANPALKLDLIVPADKQERYEKHGLDIAELKKIPHLEFCVERKPTMYRHDMHWSKPERTLNEDLYDFAKADAKDLAVNGVVGSVRSSYTYFETFTGSLKMKPYNCYFENADAKPWGRHFLREAAFSIAAYDMMEYLSGAQPLPSVGFEEESREFARNFRFLPKKPFKDVTGIRDPVVARYLPTENGTYWYAVNVFHEQVTVKLDLGGEKATLTLKPYELRSGLVEGKTVEAKDLEFVSVAPEAETFYSKRIAQLEAAIAKLEAAGLETAEEKQDVATLKALKAKNLWAELYRVAYSRRMNQLVRKQDNIDNLLVIQQMEKTGAWRVDCGSNNFYKAPDGRMFAPDVPFNGTYGCVGKFERASRDVTGIRNTDLPDLYKTESYWIGTYRFKVPDGKYRVKLYMKYSFKRGFEQAIEKGKLFMPFGFFAAVNDAVVCNNLDYADEMEKDFNKALQYTSPVVESKDGEIVITLRPVGKTHPSVPHLNAIEIEPAGTN